VYNGRYSILIVKTRVQNRNYLVADAWLQLLLASIQADIAVAIYVEEGHLMIPKIDRYKARPSTCALRISHTLFRMVPSPGFHFNQRCYQVTVKASERRRIVGTFGIQRNKVYLVRYFKQAISNYDLVT
jgi:hypothetical protein